MTTSDWPYKNFSKDEMQCKCGCGLLPPAEFMDKLQALRTIYAAPMAVTSGARCQAYNKKVSETGDDGPHTKGAVDIRVAYQEAALLVRTALAMGVTGLGVSQKGASRFIHLDWLPNAPGQPRPRIWSY